MQESLACLSRERRDDKKVELCKAIELVHKTMSDFKTKLTNRAILLNLTSLSPVLYNKTRWAGKLFILCRFLRFHKKMIRAASVSDRPIYICSSTGFRTDVKRFANQLEEIQSATLALQKMCLPLSDYRFALDSLLEMVYEFKLIKGLALHDCMIGDIYIGPDLDFLSTKVLRMASISCSEER